MNIKHGYSLLAVHMHTFGKENITNSRAVCWKYQWQDKTWLSNTSAKMV